MVIVKVTVGSDSENDCGESGSDGDFDGSEGDCTDWQ